MTKYSSQEVAHKWYYGGPDESFAGSNFFTDGDCASLYSYGLHFIVAHRVNSRSDLILFNASRYSNSTVKHQAHAHSAIDQHKSEVIYVPNLDMVLCDAFDALGDPHLRTKATHEHWLGTLRRYIDNILLQPFNAAAEAAEKAFEKRQTPKGKKLAMGPLMKDFGAMHATFRAVEDTLDIISRYSPADDTGLNDLLYNKAYDRYMAALAKFEAVYGNFSVVQSRLDAEAKAKRDAALNKSREQCQKDYDKGLADWRAGKRRSVPYIELFNGGAQLLRISGNNVETTGGIKIPINDGMKILARIVRSFEAGKLPFGTLAKAVTGRASGVFQNYPINEITREKWVIGCHTIPFTEIVHIANKISTKEAHNG